MKTSWVLFILKIKFWDGYVLGNYELRMIFVRKLNFLVDICSYMILVIFFKMVFFIEIICVVCVFYFKEFMMILRVLLKIVMYRIF